MFRSTFRGITVIIRKGKGIKLIVLCFFNVIFQFFAVPRLIYFPQRCLHSAKMGDEQVHVAAEEMHET